MDDQIVLIVDSEDECDVANDDIIYISDSQESTEATNNMALAEEDRIQRRTECEPHQIKEFKASNHHYQELLTYTVIPTAENIARFDDERLPTLLQLTLKLFYNHSSSCRRYFKKSYRNSFNYESTIQELMQRDEAYPNKPNRHEDNGSGRCQYRTKGLLCLSLNTPEEINAINKVINEKESSRPILFTVQKSRLYIYLNNELCDYDNLQFQITVLEGCCRMYSKKYICLSELTCDCNLARHMFFLNSMDKFFQWFISSEDYTCGDQNFQCPKCNATYHNYFILHIHILLHNPVVFHYVKLYMEMLKNKPEIIIVDSDDEAL